MIEAGSNDETLVPRYASDLDAAWLARVLQPRHPGIEVASFEVKEVTNGTCSRVRVRAEYADSTRAKPPQDLFVKTCFSDNPFFEKNRLNGRVGNEGRFYDELLPTLDVPTARLHAFAARPDEGRYVMVLDDLQSMGAAWGQATAPIRPDVADTILGHMARMHAAYWDSAAVHAMDWLPTPHADPSPQSRLRWIQPGLEGLLSGRAGEVPATMRDPEKLGQTLLKLTAHISAGPITLLHGDPHLGNFAFFGADQPVFTDWAVHRGHSVYDPGYFLPSSLSIDDRREHEQDLLRVYIACLTAAGIEAPTFDDFWLAYRAQVLYGLMVWLPVPDHMQPDVIVDAYTRRQLAACADLDCVAAIETLTR
jgi:hypothetical protein